MEDGRPRPSKEQIVRVATGSRQSEAERGFGRSSEKAFRPPDPDCEMPLPMKIGLNPNSAFRNGTETSRQVSQPPCYQCAASGK